MRPSRRSRRTLELNPFHVSAEFGLAQALLRTGHAAQAKSIWSDSST